MRRTEVLQEIRKMRFEEAYEGWQAPHLRRCARSCILTVRASTTPMRSLAKHHIYATWQSLVTRGW